MHRSLAQILFRVFCLLAVGLGGAGGFSRVWAGELVLAPHIATELNQILKVSEALHRSLVAQSEEQIEIGLRDIIWQIDRAKEATRSAKQHERGHLLKILDVAKDQFEMTQSSYGEERKARLEEGFNQLVNLVRIYRLDRGYGIFFCPKDRTSWVQRGDKPQNPFLVDLRSPCGIRVSK